jgi:hypothetical protein
MKVVCICNPHKVWKITPGKTYDMISRALIGSWNLEYIIDDKGSEFYLEDGYKNNIIDSGYFITLEEFRNKKISDILKDYGTDG